MKWKAAVLALCIGVATGDGAGARHGPKAVPVDTLEDMRAALWACWEPPPGTQSFQVTISFSLKRTGEVLGKPRITYSTFNGGPAEQRLLMARILESLETCTPVKVTPSLGGAIAGRILTMTFTSPSRKA